MNKFIKLKQVDTSIVCGGTLPHHLRGGYVPMPQQPAQPAQLLPLTPIFIPAVMAMPIDRVGIKINCSPKTS